MGNEFVGVANIFEELVGETEPHWSAGVHVILNCGCHALVIVRGEGEMILPPMEEMRRKVSPRHQGWGRFDCWRSKIIRRWQRWTR